MFWNGLHNELWSGGKLNAKLVISVFYRSHKSSPMHSPTIERIWSFLIINDCQRNRPGTDQWAEGWLMVCTWDARAPGQSGHPARARRCLGQPAWCGRAARYKECGGRHCWAAVCCGSGPDYQNFPRQNNQPAARPPARIAAWKPPAWLHQQLHQHVYSFWIYLQQSYWIAKTSSVQCITY